MQQFGSLGSDPPSEYSLNRAVHPVRGRGLLSKTCFRAKGVSSETISALSGHALSKRARACNRDHSAALMKDFLFLPWIEAHGDVLLREIFEPDPDIALIPLRMTPAGDKVARRALFHFASRHPQTYARLFERYLLAVPGPVHGLVLTHDWAGPMRIAAEVAQSHGVPVILIPHEGIFLDETLYYRSPLTGENCSIADQFLAWGHLQKDIMVSRGYPAEKVVVISSPKLQKAARYAPQLTRAAYCRELGLDPDRKIVMFCAQTLDNVTDMQTARTRQAEAVLELDAFCREHGHQLLLRLPPVQHESYLQKALREELGEGGPLCVKPGDPGIAAEPHEATWHADCVTSISSTMLLEKGLMDGPSMAFDYLAETSPFVARGRLPAVRAPGELADLLPGLLDTTTRSFPAEGWAQLEHDYSSGSFDSQSAIPDAQAIIKAYDTPFDLRTQQPKARGGFLFPKLMCAVHAVIFKTFIQLFRAG